VVPFLARQGNPLDISVVEGGRCRETREHVSGDSMRMQWHDGDLIGHVRGVSGGQATHNMVHCDGRLRNQSTAGGIVFGQVARPDDGTSQHLDPQRRYRTPRDDEGHGRAGKTRYGALVWTDREKNGRNKRPEDCGG
jgi:hypothetical protein